MNNKKTGRFALVGATTMMLVIGLLALTPTASATGYDKCENADDPDTWSEKCTRVIAGTGGACYVTESSWGTYDEDGNKKTTSSRTSTTCASTGGGGAAETKF